MYGYIYKTTNLLNNKIYIGQKHSSVFLGNKYLGSGKILRQAITKDGADNFIVELLEEVNTQDELDEREIFWIKYYRSTDRCIGYNICEGGKVNRTMVGENNPFYGKRHSDASRQKMSISQQHRTDDRSRSEESKQKMSQKMKGREITWKDKLSANAKVNPNYGMRGKHCSEQAKEKLSKKSAQWWANDKNRELLSIKTKIAWQNEMYRENHCKAMRGKKKTITYKQCPYCNEQISSNNFNRHVETHFNGKYDEKQKHYHVDHDDLYCKFCHKECKNKRSLSTHERRCKFRNS